MSDMKCYYCHECGKNFFVSDRDVSVQDPACVECGSEFVELVDNEESHSAGGGASIAAANMPLLDHPSLSAMTSEGTATSSTTTRTAATTTGSATGTTGSATATTGSSGASRTPVNITIGSNPLFGRLFFNPFMPSGNGGRESPMDTIEDEDPGDEVLSAAQLRRRNTSQVRSGSGDPNIGLFPGGMFMVSQSSRLGPNRPSLEQMIHQHIENVLAQRDAAEEADGGVQSTEQQQPTPPQQQQEGQQQQQQEGQQQQQQGQQQQQQGQQQQQQGQQQQQQGQQQQQQQQQQPPLAGGANNFSRRANFHFLNFPAAMSQRPPTSGQQASGGGGGAGTSAGTSQAGSASSANPQLGMPMFFGLPLGPLAGLHGSPSDYAWGPQGLENIISQMLANLEDNGPPPTKKEKLDSLPAVQASADDLKECSLCSVCKDDFIAGESLLKLPCFHLYHKDCILPWLEMHDTCPTCRFHINTGKYDEERT